MRRITLGHLGVVSGGELLKGGEDRRDSSVAMKLSAIAAFQPSKKMHHFSKDTTHLSNAAIHQLRLNASKSVLHLGNLSMHLWPPTIHDVRMYSTRRNQALHPLHPLIGVAISLHFPTIFSTMPPAGLGSSSMPSFSSRRRASSSAHVCILGYLSAIFCSFVLVPEPSSCIPPSGNKERTHDVSSLNT